MGKLYDEKSIESLSPLEFTRLRPGVYCGDTTYSTQLAVEIFSNCVDEYNAGHGSQIEVIIDKDTVTITDCGQGFIPNSFREDGKTILEAAFSVLNTSGKYREDGSYEGTSLGSFGIGSKITTYLSHFLTVKTCRSGQYERITFHEGVFKEREDKYPNNKYLYINGGKFIDLGHPCYYSDENYFEWTNINSIILTTEEVLEKIRSYNSDKFMKRNDREYILTDEHDCHLHAHPLECYRNYEYHSTDEVIPAAEFYESNVGMKIFGKSKTDNDKFFCQFYIHKNDEWEELKDHGFMSCLKWYEINRIIGNDKFEELFTRTGSIYDCEVKTTSWGSRDYHPFSNASMFLVDGKTYAMFGLEDGLHIIDPETGIEEISTYDWFNGKEVSKFYAR